MLKKILATALAAAMIFGLASVAFAASPFPDTAGTSNEAVIAKLKALGLVKGDENGNFKPTSPITRAEFTAMVVRMLGLEAAAGFVNTPTVFADVTAQYSWAYGYINIATGRSLIKGYGDGKFGPGDNVTQAQALTILLRALGYDDDLPGVWPIDYVMQGATLEIIETGFGADLAANRSLVASLVNNTLDAAVVEKDADVATKFNKQAYTMYEDAFGLVDEEVDVSTVSGKVTEVNTTDAHLFIDATAYDYVSGVAIYGKGTLSELVGQKVEATFNKSADIVFVTVTTKQEVIGDITAVDTVNFKLTVGGTSYTLDTTPEILKNGDVVAGGKAAGLAAVNGTSAKLLLDKTSGKVYRIEASILDKTGILEGKSSTVGADGKTVYTLIIGVTPYTLASTTTVVRNGASAAFADLKIDDDLKFSAKSDGKLVYLDAFANLVKGYTISNYIADASGATIKTTKDSVETTFVVGKNSDGVLLVTMTDILADGGGLGEVYDLTLNRDGKAVDIVLATAVGPTIEKVKTIASKDQVGSGSPVVYKYRLNFTDGTSVVLDNVDLVDGYRNGIDLAIDEAADVWNAAAGGDLYWLAENGDDFDVYLYAASVTGRVEHAGGSYNFVLENSSGVATAAFTTSWSTPVTFNGAAIGASDVPAQAHPAVSLFTAKVTFGSSSATVQPKATGLTVEKFTSGTAYPVKQVTETEDGYEVVLANPANVPVYMTVEDTIVMKGGVKVTPAELKIGDKVQFDAEEAAYVKATADTAAAKITLASYTYAGTTATVTFTLDEVVKSVVLTAGSVTKTVTPVGSGATTHAILLVLADPGVVNITVTDYAGNVSSVNAYPAV